MEIIDAQLHSSEFTPQHAPVEVQLASMAAVGVDRAVLVQARRAGDEGIGYLLRKVEEHLDTFRLVGLVDAEIGPVDPTADDQELDAQVESWRARPQTIGLRVVIADEADADRLRAGYFDRALATAERQHVPIFIFALHLFPVIEEIARRYPGLLIIIDHLGLPQPPQRTPDPDPWQDLPGLLSLASHENVVVKCSAAATLAASGYPFDDIWPYLHQIFEAYSLDRVMWGTDITRVAMAPTRLHTYAEAVLSVRYTDELTEAEKERFLGGTLRQVLKWPVSGTTS